ncbi:MAG: PTS sugar transporter subunit IIA [Myxococcales bacterium]|nr:PTS sugar transporter subunit IIA [Myxococcales bacterium]
MRLVDILTADRVALHAATESLGGKAAVLETMAQLLARGVSGVASTAAPSASNVAAVRAVLEEREGLQSTGIGDGVAIPHGFLGDLAVQIAALLVVPAGVPFDAIDDKPARIILGVVGPKKGMNAQVEHLRILARVSKVLREQSLRDLIVAAPNAAEVFRLVADADAKVP